MLESVVETKVCEFAVKQGWIVRKMRYLGRRGCRDRDFYRNGRIVMVEFKKPVDGALSALQARERKRLAETGIVIHVIDNIADGCALLV
jgi:hypothetical protein